MKKEIQIPVSVGFCKNCFRSRRDGSSYCGQCQDEPPRMKIYQDDVENFPLLEKVMKHFNLKPTDKDSLAFTYGDTIFCNNQLSYHLIAHEITHVFQQLKENKDIWWSKYLKKAKFRLAQESEAYKKQYDILKGRDPIAAEFALTHLVEDLSGRIYGNIITPDEAYAIITK